MNRKLKQAALNTVKHIYPKASKAEQKRIADELVSKATEYLAKRNSNPPKVPRP